MHSSMHYKVPTIGSVDLLEEWCISGHFFSLFLFSQFQSGFSGYLETFKTLNSTEISFYDLETLEILEFH